MIAETIRKAGSRDAALDLAKMRAKLWFVFTFDKTAWARVLGSESVFAYRAVKAAGRDHILVHKKAAFRRVCYSIARAYHPLQSFTRVAAKLEIVEKIGIAVLHGVVDKETYTQYTENCEPSTAHGDIMMKKLNYLLNIVLGSSVGVFLGHGIYVLWDHKSHPDIYAMRSAPWYASILIYGACMAVVVIIAIAIKICIRKKVK